MQTPIKPHYFTVISPLFTRYSPVMWVHLLPVVGTPPTRGGYTCHTVGTPVTPWVHLSHPGLILGYTSPGLILGYTSPGLITGRIGSSWAHSGENRLLLGSYWAISTLVYTPRYTHPGISHPPRYTHPYIRPSYTPSTSAPATAVPGRHALGSNLGIIMKKRRLFGQHSQFL